MVISGYKLARCWGRSLLLLQHSRVGKVIPDCIGPIGSIILLKALRSVTVLHFLNFFLTTNIGEFKGLVDFSIQWVYSCTCTSHCKAYSFFSVKDHCLTHVGFSINHFKGRSIGTSEDLLVVLCFCIAWMACDFFYSALLYPSQKQELVLVLFLWL